MKKIDFAIIGAQKSGTTALFDMLKQHPDICLPVKKEDGFFVQDDLYLRGGAYLSALYPECISPLSVGYSYVNIMYFHDVTAPRLYENNPDMKFVCVLRDPVQRAYSAYQFMRSRGVEDAAFFQDALLREREMGDLEDFSYQADMTYLKHGMYAEQLSTFIDLFGRDSILVFTQEELKEDYRRVCSDIFEFLGVPDISRNLIEKMSNKTGQPASRMISRLIYKEGCLKNIYKAFLGESLRRFIRRFFIGRIKKINLKEVDYHPLDEATEKQLREFYAPYNSDLESLLGRKFDW